MEYIVFQLEEWFVPVLIMTDMHGEHELMSNLNFKKMTQVERDSSKIQFLQGNFIYHQPGT
jgi:hypothetical protein